MLEDGEQVDAADGERDESDDEAFCQFFIVLPYQFSAPAS